MKKILNMTLVAVAAMMVISCAKQEPELVNISKGTKVSFIAEAPSIDYDTPDTKVSSDGTNGATGTAIRYKFKWDAGDKIALYTITPATKDEYTYWDDFVTEAGGSSADFTGQMPDSYKGTSLIGLHSKYTETFTVYWNTSRTDFGYNIPSTQDGTGFKYALYCGITANDFYDEENNKILISGSDPANPAKAIWQMVSAITRFTMDLGEGVEVNRIDVSANYSDGTVAKLASGGSSKDIYTSSANIYTLWSGNSSVNTITIENGGQALPNDIYFTSRNANGTTNGKYVILTFVFTNSYGKTATRVMKMATGISEDGKNASTPKNIAVNKINRLGTVTLNAEDFQ